MSYTKYLEVMGSNLTFCPNLKFVISHAIGSYSSVCIALIHSNCPLSLVFLVCLNHRQLRMGGGTFKFKLVPPSKPNQPGQGATAK